MSIQKTPPITIEKQGKVIHMTDEGLGRIIDDEGKNIDLPFCLTGETVLYHEVQRRRKTDYYFKGIEKKSNHRIDPICPHFTKCGGCTLQHMSMELYKEYKKSIILSLFVQKNLDPFVVDDPVFLNSGQRRRVNMDFVKKNGTVFLGFHGLKSHSIVNVEVCPVVDADIEAILHPLREALSSILKDYQKGKVFILKTDVGLDISLEIQEVSTLSDEDIHALETLSQKTNLCRLIFKYRKTKRVIFQKEEPYVTINSVKISVDPWCFLQASQMADETLIQWVLDALPQKIINCIDLFCGRGTFTFALSRFANVKGYEGEKSAIEALESANTIAKRPITTFVQDLFLNPLKSDDFKSVDVVVIDPPRAGAKAQCVELSTSTVPLIVYVSCNPKTFVEDALQLQRGGYKLEKVHLLDQFIFTHHMEVVGIFKKK
ncbi:MAG: class I SAM-dependent RNA methyltransferase [Proteobacteria bacterium]|nr:class I SAM-dependent RNA methyltransferase [Pseudomonadota bacterium]